MVNLGINIIETNGTASAAIAGAPTSVAGFIIRSRRGPTNEAVRISNFRDFKKRFGSYDSQFMGAYCVDGFFLNGGREAYVTRVLGSSNTPASVTLLDRMGTGNPTLKVTAGYRGTTEPGEWGDDLSVEIRDNPRFSTALAATLGGNQPARLQGTALTGPVDLTFESPRSLSLVIDGAETPISVPLDAATLPNPAAATAADIVAAINSRVGNRLVASVAADGILLVSRSKGETSTIAVTATPPATLDLIGWGDAATNTPGTAATAPYTEVQVNSISGFQIGEQVRLDDGITQNWHTITGLVERETATGDINYFIQWQAPDGSSDQNEYRIEDNATLATCEFDLLIHQLNTGNPIAPTLETWEKLTLDPLQVNYAISQVNNEFSGSAHVVLEDQNNLETEAPPRRRSTDPFRGSDSPALGTGFRLGQSTPTTTSLSRTPGSDGDAPATNDYRDALSRFDTRAIQLLAIPESMPDGVLRAVTRTAISYCENETIKGDCMFVGHTPANRDVSGAKTFGRDFQASKVYGALYWPWITVTDPTGTGPNPIKQIPPTGHVLGVYARIDQTRGVWKAPAGNEAFLRGALTIEQNITDRNHTDLVKNGSVNGIRQIRGTGIVIDASRTLSTDTRWLYVSVRLLFNYVKASLREGLRWVKQEPNRETLWNKIKYNTVTPFLQRLYQSGAFGPGKAEDVFTVICGLENNPPEQITLGNLQVEIYFNPGRPAETILITIGQQDSGASASER